jgi:hypothetical protein
MQRTGTLTSFKSAFASRSIPSRIRPTAIFWFCASALVMSQVLRSESVFSCSNAEASHASFEIRLQIREKFRFDFIGHLDLGVLQGINR